MNKRGQTTALIFILIIGLFIGTIILFVSGILVVKTNDILSQNISMGQVNLSDINEQSFGKFSSMYLNYADWWGMSIIMGMVFGMILSAYFIRGRYPKIGIVFDIFIILVAFFTALYFSDIYQTILDSFASAGETFLEDYTPKTSQFILNLPVYIVVLGVILMIIFHSSIPAKKEEVYISNQGGYIQGI